MVISSLVEVVLIEVTVIDGILADMVTRPNLILMAILAAEKSSLLPATKFNTSLYPLLSPTDHLEPNQVSVETIWVLLIGSIRPPFDYLR